MATSTLKLSQDQKKAIELMRLGHHILYDPFGDRPYIKHQGEYFDLFDSEMYEMLNEGLIEQRGKPCRGIVVFRLTELGKTIELC